MLQLREIYRDGYLERFAEDWRSGKFPRFLLGTNKLAQDIAGEVEVDGFINTVSSDACFMGKPIIHALAEVPRDALVVHCVISWKVSQLEIMLARHQFRYMESTCFSKEMHLQVEIFHFTGWEEDIRENFDEYNKIYGLLSDRDSRNTFHNLVNYKYSGDWRYLRGFSNRQDEQYFENFLQLPDAPVFADIGGYHGETSLAFIKRYPAYKGIHFFEPEKENMVWAKEKLRGAHDVSFIEFGCSNRQGMVGFTSDGSSSKVEQNGSGGGVRRSI